MTLLRTLALLTQAQPALAADATQKIMAMQQAEIASLKAQVAALQPKTYAGIPHIVAMDPISSSIRAADGSTLTIQKVGFVCTALANLKIGHVEVLFTPWGLTYLSWAFAPVYRGWCLQL